MRKIVYLLAAPLIAAALIAVGAQPASAGPIKVLFLAYDTGAAGSVFADIMGSDPRFDLANSSYVDEGSTGVVPSLATLQQYNAVLVWSNYTPGAGLGDRLADYVDAGGGVVLASFDGYWASYGLFPGRVNTPGYNPLTGGTTDAYNSLSLGAYNPSSPIMAGVTTLSSSYYNGDWTGVDPGASLVASWSDGRPLAAVSASGKVANVTLFPNVVTYGHASGDYELLFRNALAVTGEAPQTAVPEPGSLALALLGGICLCGVQYKRLRRKAQS